MSGITKFKLVALDSNIFIYYFETNPNFVGTIDLIFKKLAANKLQAVTSMISLIESLSYPSPPDVLKGIMESFQIIPNLQVLEVNKEIALKAAEIRRKYKFKLPDSVQIATAISAKAQVFITNDYRLKSFKRLKIIPLSDLA